MGSFTPVSYDFRETIASEIQRGSNGKIFFFNDDNVVDSAEGKVIKLEEIQAKGMYITLEPTFEIRIDRIITLFGKPGAAFDEYDNFANQCLACTGGYEI